MDKELQTLFVRNVPKATVDKIRDYANANGMKMAGAIIKLASKL